VSPGAEDALALARAGYFVFPCVERRKEPATSRGWQDATQDERLIRNTWNGRPLNIGIACSFSKIAVVDIDTKHGADPALVIPELGLTQHPVVWTGEAPARDAAHPTSLEGVRGAQVYARAADLPTVKLDGAGFPGVELRGQGAYVIGPPSVHPCGTTYEGEVVPTNKLRGMAGKMRELVRALGDAQTRMAPENPGDRIAQGARHETLLSLGGTARRRGDDGTVLKTYLAAVNKARCDPPLPDEEIDRLVRFLLRKEPAPTAPRGNGPNNRTLPPEPADRAKKSVRSGGEHSTNGDRTPPPDLARDSRILDRLDESIGSMGVVGERHLARATYLVHVSRLLHHPARQVVKGDSSTGKSFVTERALRHAAPEELFVRTQTSALALFYTEDDLRHRTLVFLEANKLGDDDDDLARVLRTLISEDRLKYEVTDVRSHATKLLEKEGPVAFISTTCKASLDDEIETRILSLHSDSSDGMTREVVRRILLGATEAPTEPDLGEWHALDRWLAANKRPVVIPWAAALAGFDLAGPPRLRRDISNLLALARANALLHQATREIDGGGRIVADLDDYRVVVELLSDALAIATDKAVREGVRRVVEAVSRLRGDGDVERVTLRRAAAAAGASPSTTHHDAHEALDRGYLANRSSTRGRFDLDLGDPLPEQHQFLPTADELAEAFGSRSPSVRPPTEHSLPHRQAVSGEVFGCSVASRDGGEAESGT
jgi:Bifunctional DNA primase/polymerase, N-terminal/Primase C terminal 1 (PriCT-1)